MADGSETISAQDRRKEDVFVKLCIFLSSASMSLAVEFQGRARIFVVVTSRARWYEAECTAGCVSRSRTLEQGSDSSPTVVCAAGTIKSEDNSRSKLLVYNIINILTAMVVLIRVHLALICFD